MKVGKYSAVEKIGVSVPEAGIVIANKGTAESHEVNYASNDRGEKATSKLEIKRRARMRQGSENGCTTNMGGTIEEVSLAEVLEEKQSVL